MGEKGNNNKNNYNRGNVGYKGQKPANLQGRMTQIQVKTSNLET